MSTRLADPVRDRETPRPPGEMMLRSLPAQHQEIIIATYFRRRTIPEVAQLLGLAPSTAKARLYQAMRDLSEMAATGWPDHAPYPAACSAADRQGTADRQVRARGFATH
jgi:RNA polymerase sigma-70 factor (ECF subfamily)